MKNSGISIKFPPIFLGAGAVLVTYASSLYSYLLFHSLVEMFSVLVAFVIFVLTWNTRRVQDSHYLLFIGIASLFSGTLDLAHTFAYKGLGVFPGYGADLGTQLWVAFRYVFSLSFLFAPSFIERKLNPPRTFAAYFIITSLLLVTIFLRRFPACYAEGTGLTPFKIISEYIISFIFLASLGRLLQKHNAFDRGVLRLLVLSLLSSMASELSFTQYASVYGFANMVGHYFELLSYYLIYRAIVVTGVVEPSNLLFRNLKLSEAALKESEAKYRSLFENMIDGFAYHKIVVDRKGKPVDYVFLEANNAFEKLTGLKRQDITGKRVTGVLPGIENDPADWIGTYGQVALEGKEIRFEQYAEPLGKWFSVSAYCPMREYFVTVFEDITERKRVEEALRKVHDELEVRVQNRTAELANTVNTLQTEVSERLLVERVLVEQSRILEAFFKHSAAPLVFLDKEFNFIRVNDAYAKACSREVSDFHGHNHFADYPSDELKEKFARVVKTKEPFSVFARPFTFPDHPEWGVTYWDLFLYPVLDSSGEVDFLVFSLHDMTERKRADEKVLRLNRLYSVLSKINEAIVRIHDPEKLYEQVCRIAVEDGLFKMAWIGLTDPEALMVKPVAKWGDTGGYLDHIKIYAADVSEGRGPTGTAVLEGTYSICSDIEHDKRMLPWRDKALRHGFRSSAAFPIRAGSAVIGAFTIYSDTPQFFTSDEINLLNSLVEDISFATDFLANEKKRLEAEEGLRRLNEELEQRVAARTAELEAANKELEAFAYSVSHDLRAPLRIIDGFSRAIEEDHAGRLDETGKDYFQRVRGASRRMAQLIDALLSLSRQTRGEPHRTTVDMSSLAKAATDDLRKTQPDRRVEFMIADAVTVQGDLVMLRAALENLLGNAWKFTEKRDPARIEFGVLECGLRNADCGMRNEIITEQIKQGEAVYFVRDNGAGFDMAYANKLFNAFQRLHTTDEFPGLGIGLATVQRIVHRHGGRIWAEGAVDKGATFYFTMG